MFERKEKIAVSALSICKKRIFFTYQQGSSPRYDASYIYLKENKNHLEQGESVKQIVIDITTLPGGEDIKGDLVLDINANNRICGIEILGDVIPDELKKA